jgi:RimJ/RimL family protein N-acetyltransferase
MPGLFQSERLVYEALDTTQADKDFVFASVCDPETIHPGGVGVPRPWRRKTSDEFLERITANPLLAVKICLPASSTHQPSPAGQTTTIGFLVLRKFGDGREPTLQTDCGPVYIAAEYRQKGYATEAMKWALDWAFRHARVHRVALQTNGDNVAANALYRGLGFFEEGRMRDAHYFDGRFVDIIMFSMLESEWAALKAQEQDGILVS